MNVARRTVLAVTGVLVFLLVGSVLLPASDGTTPGRATLERGPAPAPAHPPLSRAAPAAATLPNAGLAGPFNGSFFSTRDDNPTGVASFDYAIQVDPSTHVAYLSSVYASAVVSFNDANGTLRNFTVLGSVYHGHYVTTLSLDTRDHLLFVSVYGSPHSWLYALNESTFHIVANLSFAGAPHPRFVPIWMAWDAASDQVFIQNSSGDEVAAVNASTLASPVYLTCPLTLCGAGGLTAVPAYHQLVWNTRQNYSLVFDTENNLLEGVLWAPPTASTAGAAYDALDDVLFVGNDSTSPSGALLRFDPVSFNYLGAYAGIAGLQDLQYDERTNTLVGVGPVGHQEIASWNAASGTQLGEYNDTLTALSEFLSVAIDSSSGLAVTAGLYANATVAFALPTLSRIYSASPYPLLQLAAAVDPNLGDYYVYGYLPDLLVARSESTGAVVWSDSFPTTSIIATALAVDVGAGKVYLGRPAAHAVQVLDAATGASLGSVALPSTVYATAVAVDPANHLLYIARNDSTISVASTLTDLVVGSVATPGTVACSLVADPATGEAFGSNCAVAGNVTTVNGLTVTLGTVYPVGVAPFGMALDGAGYLYVANSGGTNVTVVRPSSGLVVGSISLAGAVPRYLAIDEAAGLLFAISPSNATAPVVSLTTRAVLGSLPLGDYVGVPDFDPHSLTLVVPRSYAATTLVATQVVRPEAPTGLVVTAGNTTAAVTWTSPPATAGSPFTYNVSVATNASGPWTLRATTTRPNASLSGLSDGTTYFVTVNATNAAGTGPDAVAVSFVPAGVPYPPTAVQASASGSSRVNVSWGAPASSGGLTVLNYTVVYQASGGAWNRVSAGTGTSWTVAGLSAQTAYRFYVIAWNRLGASNPSTTVSATTPAAPAPSSAIGGLPYWAWAVVGVVLAAVVLTVVLLLARRRRGPGTSGAPASWTPPPGATGEPTPPPGAPPATGGGGPPTPPPPTSG